MSHLIEVKKIGPRPDGLDYEIRFNTDPESFGTRDTIFLPTRGWLGKAGFRIFTILKDEFIRPKKPCVKRWKG